MIWTSKDRWQLALIALCVAFAFLDFMIETALPRLHGRVAPAVGPLVITDISPGNNDYLSRVAGHAEKNNDCAFVRVAWALGSRGGRYASVSAKFLDRPTIREQGVQTWERLMVDLEAAQSRNNSFGTD